MSDDMKEGPTLSSMGETVTIYEGGWSMTYIGFDHHKKWTQAAAVDDQGKIIRCLEGLKGS